MNIFVNIDVFIHLYIIRLLCNARMQKEKDEGQKPDKKRFLFAPKKTRFKYIILKRNENNKALTKMTRH